jgi:Flp pilus assembly protein TadG
MSSVRRCRGSERGAVLVHVAIATVGLLALSAVTVDFGVKWIARAQAQNAADAGALAGAIALSFDDPNDLTDAGMAKQSALRYALANPVWGQAPAVNVSTDITFPACPDGTSDQCVQVDVFRNQQRGNALPTLFAQFVGVMDQGVRATATAQVRTGNSTDCLRPWAIVDRWDEFNPPEPPDVPDIPDPDFTPQSTFDRYSTGQGNSPPQEPDLYVPPTQSSPGTGFTVTGDYGRQFGIKTGPPGNGAISSGWFRSLDLPRVDTGNLGGDAYGSNIVSCNGYPTSIASDATQCPTDGSQISTHEEKVYWAARGCVRVQTGNMQGPTISGIEDVYNRDPSARWNPSLNNGRGGVANSCCTPSPRIVPISVIHIDAYLAADPTGSGGVVKLVNIFGFFIEGLGDIDQNGNITFNPNNPLSNGNKVVVGRLMTLPGLFTGSSNIDDDASFLRTILLVR